MVLPIPLDEEVLPESGTSVVVRNLFTKKKKKTRFWVGGVVERAPRDEHADEDI